jgi:transcriptional pleiotropic regulator of transition state genes
VANEPGTNSDGGNGNGSLRAPVSPRGVPRKIDQLGRVVIPSEYRKIFGMAEGDVLDLTIEGDAVVVRRVEHRCVLCGGLANLFAFRERYVCRSCADDLRGNLAPAVAPAVPVPDGDA